MPVGFVWVQSTILEDLTYLYYLIIYHYSYIVCIIAQFVDH